MIGCISRVVSAKAESGVGSGPEDSLMLELFYLGPRRAKK
jgi:hypothetical protein